MVARFLAYRIYDIEYRFFGGCPKFSFEEKNLDWDPKKICAGVFEDKNRGGEVNKNCKQKLLEGVTKTIFFWGGVKFFSILFWAI